MAKGKSSRLDFATLDTAHKQFMVLAREESRPEVRRALDQAAHITATLLIAVSAVCDMQLFFDITTRPRRRR
jgi:hypothetical protein